MCSDPLPAEVKNLPAKPPEASSAPGAGGGGEDSVHFFLVPQKITGIDGVGWEVYLGRRCCRIVVRDAVAVGQMADHPDQELAMQHS